MTPLLTRLTLAVVFCWGSFAMPLKSFGEMSLGLSATPIWDNEDGRWVNTRLQLTIFATETQTIGRPPYGEPEMPPGWMYENYNQPSFCDHLVLESLDDPGRVYAVSKNNVFEFPRHDGNSTFGSGLEWQTQTQCYRSLLTPDGMCDSATYHAELSWVTTCDLAMPDNCGSWRIYYVIDHRNWACFCYPNIPLNDVVPERRTIVGTGGQDRGHHCAQVDSNLIAYINNLPGYRHIAQTVNLGDCPEPPPAPGETSVKFIGYLKSDGTPGETWLPEPKDSIGLVFSLSGDPPHAIGYRIWDISMWQGECMNSPRYLVEDPSVTQPEPRTTGFDGFVGCEKVEEKFPWWDFTIGQPCKYHDFVYVKDTVTYEAEAPTNPFGISPPDTLDLAPRHDAILPLLRPWFQSSAFVGYQTNEDYDTLWLRCHDYAAHCLVTPIVNRKLDPGQIAHMDPYEAPYDQEVWSITVPFDYDGYAGNHLNYGDGISDYWEQAQFDTTDTRWIRPFITPLGASADGDTLPKGRDIDGDSWCNFAEYRGVIVRDSTFHAPSDSPHVRLDPLRKSVLVHVRNNTNDTPNKMWRDEMPGFIYNLYPDTMEAYFTDSIRFKIKFAPVDAEITETEFYRDTLFGRDVNFNRVGAGLWYYGFGGPSQKPMQSDGIVRAITYWKWSPEFEPPPNNWVGRNYHNAIWGEQGESGSVPDQTVRISINMQRYNEIRELVPRYRDSLDVWMGDFGRDCRRTIAHEFGHSVGMVDIDTLCNRSIVPPLMGDGCVDTLGFILQDSVYSATSKAEFSTKEPQ